MGSIILIQGCRVQVEAWIPRDYAIVENGRFITRRIGGGHLARVRDLRTGQTRHLSDACLVDAVTIRTDEPDGRTLRRQSKLRVAAVIDTALVAMLEDARCPSASVSYRSIRTGTSSASRPNGARRSWPAPD